MEKKTNTNNGSNSTRSSYNQIHSETRKPSSKIPKGTKNQIHIKSKNKEYNQIRAPNYIKSQTIFNDNQEQNYSPPQQEIKEINAAYHYQPQTLLNPFNVQNYYYHHQPIFNDFKVPNEYHPQSKFTNQFQFQGENCHPNMENQMNIQISNFPNIIGMGNDPVQINNLFNRINDMKNEMNNMKEDYEFKMKDYESKLSNMKKEMNDMKVEYESKLNDVKNEMDSITDEINKVNFKLEDGLKEVKLNVDDLYKKLNLNYLIEDKYIEATNRIIDLLNEMIANSEKIKDNLNNTIKDKSLEINQLKNEVKFLKERIIMLQSKLIGRKLLKILLKKICENCFDSISLSSDYTIINVHYKDQKYVNMKGIANRILDALFKTNHIVHIDGEINEIIDIINSNVSYGRIFEICKKSFFKKNDADIIEQLLNDKDLYNQICYEDIIAKDKELKELLNSFVAKKNLFVNNIKI